jgi:hypothetical protein
MDYENKGIYRQGGIARMGLVDITCAGCHIA